MSRQAYKAVELTSWIKREMDRCECFAKNHGLLRNPTDIEQLSQAECVVATKMVTLVELSEFVLMTFADELQWWRAEMQKMEVRSDQ